MLTDYDRTATRAVRIGPIERGALWDTLIVTGELPGCEAPGGLRCEIRLFHGHKRVELHYLARKRREFGPEAIYVALPFGLDGAELLFETLGGMVAPERGEVIPGTASDWQSIQNVITARAAKAQVVVASDEIPLMQLGGLNTGRFQREMKVERPHAYSWVMNNYWVTNFHAGSEGDLRWRYAITSTDDTQRSAAVRFGFDVRVPVLARIVRGNDRAGSVASPTVVLPGLPALPENVLLVAARPARSTGGVVLHLREVDGRGATRIDLRGLELDGAPARVRLANAIEDPIGDAVEAIELGPFDTRFLLVTDGQEDR
jgi:hypothetical protein